ncbi:MAG: 8-oxo-dGTP diphosphatase [Saprospiraceae bacterium]|jgi:8-oxo-dGTP diphosphatase
MFILPECVSFILIKDNAILIEQRRLDKENDPGLFAIPGGHCEAGETHEQTLQRELKEELGILSLGHEYVCSLIHPGDEEQIIHYYLVKQWEGDIQCYEATEMHWVPINESQKIDIAADRIALSEYLRLRKN